MCKLSLLLLPFLYLSCQGNSPEAYWFKSFHGKAGDKTISLYISKGDQYSGTVWLEDEPYPFDIFTDEDMNNSANEMTFRASGKVNTLLITAAIRQNELTGLATLETENRKIPLPLTATESKSLSFDYYHLHYQDSVQGDYSVPFEYSSGIIWAPKESTQASAYNKIIADLAGMPPTQPQTFLEKDRDSMLHTWQEQNRQANDYKIPYQKIQMVQLFTESRSTFTISEFSYEYTGGAHGNYITRLVNISKASGEKVILTDLISQEGIEFLPRVLETVARAKYDIENEDSLKDNGFFVDTIEPSENFYISDSGIGFYYSLYEILPYVKGEVVLFVPFESLKSYLL